MTPSTPEADELSHQPTVTANEQPHLIPSHSTGEGAEVLQGAQTA